MNQSRPIAALVVCSGLLVTPLGALEPSIRFQHLSLEEGLSQNTVHSIVQDQVGFMWFGTQDGLNRWDGYELVIYRHDSQDPTSVPEGSISSLIADPTGDLWIGTEGGGIARWSHQSDSFTRWVHDPRDAASVAGDQVRSIVRDADGDLWIGTFANGLDRFDPQAQTFTHFRHRAADPSSLVDDRIRSLHLDRAGDLWISTLSGLDVFDHVTGRFVHRLSTLDGETEICVRSAVEDGDGYLWVGTLEQGLVRIDPFGSGFLRFEHQANDPRSLSGNRVRVLFVDDDQRLWVGTDSGLDLFNGETGTFTRYSNDLTDPDSLSANRIASMYQDRGGVVWVGTQGGGVNWWNPVSWSFAHYGESNTANPSGLSSNAVMALSENEETSEVWVGTLGGGLNRWNRETDEITHFRHSGNDPMSLSDDRVMSLLEDGDGGLWVGTLAGGLNHFDSATESFARYRHDPDDGASLASDGVMDIFEDSDGQLWLGTFGGGLSRFIAESETFVTFRHSDEDPTSLSDDRAGSIVEDLTGMLWIGTHGGGLNRFDPTTESFSRFRHDAGTTSSLSTDRIYSLHVGAFGELWVGTAGGGLAKLEQPWVGPDEAVFRTYSDRDGLPNTTINGIRADGEGQLWLSTNRGLSRFDPLTETFTNFDTLHGLQSLEFNVGAHHMSTSGELFFGGFGGFNAFFPAEIETNEYAPAMVITNATTGGGKQVDTSLSGPIELGPRDAYLAIEVSALDFTAPARNRYAYTLGKGGGDEWIDLGHNRNITLAGLDPGSYELSIRGSNNEGVWSEQSLDLEVKVAPPPWRSTLAFTIYALVLGAGGVSYVRTQSEQRIRQQQHSRGLEQVVAAAEENLQAERERASKLESLGILAGGIAHDFNNLLMGISGNLDLARHSITAPAKLHTYLERANTATHRAAALARQLVTFAKGGKPVKKLTLIEPVVRDAARLSLTGSKSDCVFVVKNEALRAHIDIGQMNQVISNLVINADQAMPHGGRIEIRIEEMVVGADEAPSLQPGNYVRISVCDSGHGIPEDHLPKIFDPYFTTKQKGSGLGLATAYSIVKNHLGLLRVVSEVGTGSTFEILFPISSGSPEETTARAVRSRAQSSGLVLVMDDDQVVLRSVASMLDHLGFDVSTASDSASAIAAFEGAHSSRQPFDFVLLDLTMRGGMGGCEVLAKLKKIDSKVKAIVCSGYSDDPVLSNPGDHGFCAVLEKPFRLSELETILRQAERSAGDEFEAGTTAAPPFDDEDEAVN